MKKSQWTEEQITYALRQVEAGTLVADVCRKLGVSEQTFYRWKKKYADMGVSELRRLRQVEEENRRFKQLVADLTLDYAPRGDSKKAGKPSEKREIVQFLRLGFQGSERRACRGSGHPAVSQSPRRPDRSADATPGFGNGPRTLWVSALACLAPAGRLAGQPYTGLSALSAGRVVLTAQNTEETGTCGAGTTASTAGAL